MSNPTDNMPDDIREYRAAMQAWDLAAAEWLALDPEQVFRLDVTERPISELGGATIEVAWEATERLTPRVGYLHAPNVRSDGITVTWSGAVSLDYDDSKVFRGAVGPKPVAPWETPEARAAFAQLRGLA